jgi:hypothetical protein
VDEAVIKYYRMLLREGFEHAGSLENPSVFLDSVGEKVRVCQGPGDYLHMFINVNNNTIEDIR